MKLPINFPSEAEQLRQQLRPLANATAHERLLAVADALAAAEALSMAGGRRAEQLQYQEACERQWRESMTRFIAQHVRPTSQSGE
jgi:hypothetical protein